WVVFAPSTVPYGLLGPFGSATKYLLKHHKIWLQVGYVVTWLIHIGEALYSLKLCKNAEHQTHFSPSRFWFMLHQWPKASQTKQLSFGGLFRLFFLEWLRFTCFCFTNHRGSMNEEFNRKDKCKRSPAL
ncbi:hypothetical protein EYD10_06545, partial [Varanus komodoensis]